ncbi:MAG: 30S ribosomal protein S20 [Omnitrophica bacterium]|nr:30S ribosomal protein S20 [Candidatus Omnitrophota bacterium]
MPQKRAARKEIRKSKKKHPRNTKIISELKTAVKKFNGLLSQKKYDEAKEFLKAVNSKFSKATAKGVIRKNTSSRKISRLSKNLHRAANAQK